MMDQIENRIIEFFNRFDIRAEKIPESDEKTPDFFIEHKGDRILIELKSRFDSDELTEKRENDFKKGQIHEFNTMISRDNQTSNRVKDAYKQLKTQKKEYDADYCYIFLLASGFHPHTQFSKFEMNLYGIKEIMSVGDEIYKGHKKCFYYTHSDINRIRNIIDGAFIMMKDQFYRLCINNLSVNHHDSKESDFVKRFYPHVQDPLDQEGNGEAYIVEGDIDRSDEESVKSYISKRYGLKKFNAFDWPEFNATTQINLRELEEELNP